MPRRVLFTAACLVLLLAAPAAAAPELVPVVDASFAQPTHVTGAPGDRRLYVVEKAGVIRVVRDGALLDAPFLDIRDAVLSSGSEQGLLSVAFPPDHSQSRRFYVAFTRRPDGDVVIAEYRRASDSNDRADAATRRDVITLEHSQFANHNGGQLLFGPDALLYIGTGDGGSARDPDNSAQTLSDLGGKLLRVDPRGDAPGQYTIPADNPFAATAGARGEIWQLGLRNPWRFSFDRATGDLWIGDVGQDDREEVDVARAGQNRGPAFNWGWRCWEGTIRTPNATHTGNLCDDATANAIPKTGPVHDYPHGDLGYSITGGFVARDPNVPSLLGRYVFADYGASPLRSLDAAAPAATSDDTGMRLDSVSSFGEDTCGRMYVASLSGPVRRIREAGAPEAACAPADPPLAAPPATPGTPVGGTGGADTRAPKLTAALGSLASVVKTGRLHLRVRCDEPCTVRASVAIAGVRARARDSVKAGPTKRATLSIKLTPKQRRAINRRLLRTRRATLTISLAATDQAGNVAHEKRTARLRAVARRSR